MARQLLLQRGLTFRQQVHHQGKHWTKVEAYTDGHPEVADITAEQGSENQLCEIFVLIIFDLALLLRWPICSCNKCYKSISCDYMNYN